MEILINILLIILIISIFILTTKIQIEFKDIRFKSNKNGEDSKNISEDNLIYIKVYILNKILVFKTKIDKKMINKLKSKKKIKEKIIKQIEKQRNKIIEEKIDIKRELKDIIKNVNIRIINFDLNAEIGIKNFFILAFLITIISSLINIFISINIKNIKKYFFEIKPIYNKNIFNLQLNSIFEIKLIHIIITICIIKMKRRFDKNERTSYRKNYDYSYE